MVSAQGIGMTWVSDLPNSGPLPPRCSMMRACLCGIFLLYECFCLDALLNMYMNAFGRFHRSISTSAFKEKLSKHACWKSLLTWLLPYLHHARI